MSTKTITARTPRQMEMAGMMMPDCERGPDAVAESDPVAEADG